MKLNFLFEWIFTVLGILIFIMGFININIKKTTSSNVKKYDKAHIKKIVFIVIDALRYDMVNETKKFGVFKQSVQEFVFLDTPSVTLPRIKSLVSGSNTGFIDLLLNIKSSKLTDDNILHRLKRERQFNIEFYGDDTWLKLFPNFFSRYDGTLSFFVKDFYTVDFNVTRHINDILSNSERWDAVILHYLGLDHIGHVEGPKSDKVPTKLSEMGDVFIKLVNSLVSDETLIIVSGDHGMSDLGGHGGASKQELTTGAVFVHPQLRERDKSSSGVNQIDICTAIALLTGVTIPANSLGVIPYSLLQIITEVRERTRALLYNIEHLISLSSVHYQKYYSSQLSDIITVFSDKDTDDYHHRLISFLKQIQEDLKKEFTSNTYNTDQLEIGICFLIFSVLNITLGISFWKFSVLITFLFSTGLFIENIKIVNLFCILKIIVSVTILYIGNIKVCKLLFFYNLLLKYRMLLLIPLLHFVSMFSSSFVEEEHQFWYFISTSYFWLIVTNYFYTFLKSFHHLPGYRCFVFITLMVLDRFLRIINQTGDKWSHLADFGDFMDRPENVNLLLLSIFIAVLGLVLFSGITNFFTYLLMVVFFVSNLLYRLMDLSVIRHFISPDWFIHLCYVVLVILMFAQLFVTNQDLCTSSQLILMLTTVLCRHHNLLILLGFSVKRYLVKLPWIRSIHADSPWRLVILYQTIGMVSFYQMGNSHSITTVDMQSGYVGLSNYNMWLVGFFITVHTWCGPLFWLFACMEELTRRDKQKIDDVIAAARCIHLVVAALPCLATALVCSIMRHHLFVWSVFTPRLLYSSFLAIFITGICLLRLVFITMLDENDKCTNFISFLFNIFRRRQRQKDK